MDYLLGLSTTRNVTDMMVVQKDCAVDLFPGLT